MAQRERVEGRIRADIRHRLAKAMNDHDWNQSQAVEELIDRGLRSMGYTNGDAERGRLESITIETSKALLSFAAATLLISLVTVVNLYPVAIVLMLVSAVGFGASVYADGIQRRLPIGGDPA